MNPLKIYSPFSIISRFQGRDQTKTLSLIGQFNYISLKTPIQFYDGKCKVRIELVIYFILQLTNRMEV